MSDNVFICKICGKKYNTIHGLLIHIGQYEKISKLDYLVKYENVDLLCPICGKRNRKIDKHNRILKTCDNPICTQKLRDKTSYEKSGLTTAQKGANAVKLKWLNATKDEINVFNKKRENTFYEKYGVYHALQKEEFLKAAQNTNLIRYGYTSYSKTEMFKDMIKNYMKDNKEHIMLNLKLTILNKYGYENISSVPAIKELKKEIYNNKSDDEKYAIILKSQETQYKKYNGLLWCQTNLGHKYHRKTIIFNGIAFDSKDELNIYKYCFENNIPCIYQPDNEILFYKGVDNKIHAYHPDFKIKGILFEIKGSHFFNTNGELYCPFAREKDDIIIRDGNAKLKQELMNKNNIIIIKDGNIEELKKYI